MSYSVYMFGIYQDGFRRICVNRINTELVTNVIDLSFLIDFHNYRNINIVKMVAIMCWYWYGHERSMRRSGMGGLVGKTIFQQYRFDIFKLMKPQKHND